MRRRLVAGVPVDVPEVPGELLDASDRTWRSADSSRVWLERHRLIRRMRPLGALATMSPVQRHAFASDRWSREQERIHA